MAGAIDKGIYVAHEGRRVYFCCPGCVQAFKKEPEKYLKVLDERLRTAAGEQPAYCEKCGGPCTGKCKPR